MARIQILPLPLVTIGDATTEPFALIIDQATDLGNVQELQANLKAFKDDCCASGVLVVEGRLDVATDTEPEATSPAKAVDEYIQNVMGREAVRTINFPSMDIAPSDAAIAEMSQHLRAHIERNNGDDAGAAVG
jgi:hypothetical protein